MAIHPLWSDEYWLLLMRLFQKKPAGMKPLYSKPLVKLSLELHIPPHTLYEQMFRLRRRETPYIERLWEKYGKSPKKLAEKAERIRRMYGFGRALSFYDGVEMNETFERDFKPIAAYNTRAGSPAVQRDGRDSPLIPAMLIMILDLYFRLTPITMVEETPEVMELARLMRISAATVAEVMDVFKFCDPYLNRTDFMISPLLASCQEIWNRFGNDNPEKLSSLAAQLREFFR